MMTEHHLPRVFLVDDEELAIRRLSRLLNDSKRVEIIGHETDPVAALETLSNDSEMIDALFLDIQMPVLNGFELLSKLSWQPSIIFTTAYDEYAVKAFEVNSIDYLLKPIEIAQLDRALSRIEKNSEKIIETDYRQIAEQLAAAMRSPAKNFPTKIASRLGERIRFIELEKITHFFAQDKLTYAATLDANFVIDRTIAQLEQELDPNNFTRIHRAMLLHTNFVDEVHTWFGGRLMVRLKDTKHTELIVARDRVRELKDKLGF